MDLNGDNDNIIMEDVCEGNDEVEYYKDSSFNDYIPDSFENEHYPAENMDQKSEYTCDTCDRSFQYAYAYNNHIKEHMTCSIDGCTFTAHEKIVTSHIKTQHSTGLYYSICNLSTPEDIKQWREDRKRNFPTRENIEKRQAQQNEMLERGERLVKNKHKKRNKQKRKYYRFGRFKS